MRIIGGFLRGKKISFLKSKNTRPLKDLVKESIFNVIIHSKLININLEKSEVLDLYSGTGSFGIECISRGAKNVDFVENDRDAIFTLQNNLNKFKINENGKLYGDKINIFLQTFAKKKYNLFFLDPPFKENSYGQDLENIFKLKLFKKII